VIPSRLLAHPDPGMIEIPHSLRCSQGILITFGTVLLQHFDFSSTSEISHLWFACGIEWTPEDMMIGFLTSQQCNGEPNFPIRDISASHRTAEI
jgi:hypothetical protein